jgi:oligopeptide transport system ATP-binding protein
MLTANEILEWDDSGSPAVLPLLEVDGLSKSYGLTPASGRTQFWRPWQRSRLRHAGTAGPASKTAASLVLDRVSFALMPGASTGIVGAEGAGKSTLARLITGQLAPDAGSATRSCQVQLMPQDGAAFFPARQTIANAIAAAFAPQRLTTDAARLAADQLLERVGLTPSLFATDTMMRLTKGQRQRVGIALALVGEPQVIILDEPTAGLGAVAAAPLLELLQDLRVERGLTYLLLTRDAGVARALTETSLTLAGGRIVDPQLHGAT